jgi:predicted aspartyl protease
VRTFWTRWAGTVSLLVTLAWGGSAEARDVPDALRELVRRGATEIVLRSPGRIPLVPNALPGSPGPYVRVRLNGRGPFLFVFDTGATVTILDAETARRAGIPVVYHRERNSIVKIHTADFGDVVLRDQYAFMNPGLKEGVGVDGVLGFNAFGTKPVRIDGAALTVYDVLPATGQAVRVPLLEDHSGWRLTAVPLIPLTAQNTTIPVLIDTGDDGWIDLLPDDVKDVPLETALRPAHVEYNPNTGETRTMLGRAAAPFAVAGTTVKHPVFRTDPALPVSDIGWPFLAQLFPIVFDRAHRAVYFTSANRPAVAPPLRTLPFRIRFRGGVARVSDIVPDTPVAGDIAVGDRIEAIGDRAASGYDAGTFDALLQRSATVRVRWIHDGISVTRDIPVLSLP